MNTNVKWEKMVLIYLEDGSFFCAILITNIVNESDFKKKEILLKKIKILLILICVAGLLRTYG